MPCLICGFGNDAPDISRGGNVSLSLFVTSVSGSKSFASFSNHFFNFVKPPGLELALDVAKRKGRFCVKEIKSTTAEEKRTISLQEDSVNQGKKKSHPNKFSGNRRKDEAHCGWKAAR